MDENVKKNYEYWCTSPIFDDATKAELKSLEGNEDEIFDRFYRELEFGTGGLCRYKPYELLHCRKGYTGSCKLYQ